MIHRNPNYIYVSPLRPKANTSVLSPPKPTNLYALCRLEREKSTHYSYKVYKGILENDIIILKMMSIDVLYSLRPSLYKKFTV